MAEKMTFFASYYDAACLMEPDERSDFYSAIFAYVFEGVEPTLEGKVQKVAWLLVKPNLDSSIKKQEVGSLGGRPKTNLETTAKTNCKTNKKTSGKTNQKTTAKTDKDKDKEEDMDKEGEKNLPSEEDFSPPSGSVGAEAAKAAPPSPPKCPLCGTELDKTGIEGEEWWCDCCHEFFADGKVRR